jgi:hypothetical protein
MASSKIYERFGLNEPLTATIASASAASANVGAVGTEIQTEAISYEDVERMLVRATIGEFSGAGAVTLSILGGSTSVASDHSVLTGVAGVSSASASASVASSPDAQDIIIEVHSSLLADNSADWLSAKVTSTVADIASVSIDVMTEEHSLPSGESVDLEATVSTFS